LFNSVIKKQKQKFTTLDNYPHLCLLNYYIFLFLWKMRC